MIPRDLYAVDQSYNPTDHVVVRVCMDDNAFEHQPQMYFVIDDNAEEESFIIFLYLKDAINYILNGKLMNGAVVARENINILD